MNEILSTIDLMPLVELALTFVVALLGVALTAASRWIKAQTGIQVDLKNNQMINEAIDRGLQFARAKLAERSSISTKSELIALAVGYVVAGVPKALAHFQITPERVAEMIEARLFDEPETPAVASAA